MYAGHATPGAFLSHSMSRNNMDEIYQVMLETTNADLIMSAANPSFDKLKDQFSKRFNVINPQ